MKIFGKLSNSEHGNFTRFAVFMTVLFVLFILFRPGGNIFNWIGARHEISVQEKQITEYEKALEELDQRINLLTSDRDTLEKFAREQFHLAAPGEDVYIVGK